MRLKQFVGLFAVISLFIFIRLCLLGFYQALWWDSAVYIGMGKYIFSNGSVGIFEDARPIVLPLILGFLWWIRIDVALFGNIFMLVVSIAYLLLTYLIAKRLFNNFVALISTLMLALFPPFIAYSSIINADLVGGLFILLSVYLLIKQNNFFAGIFLSLAVMTKFTSIIVAPAILLCIILSRENIFKKSISFSLGFSTLFLPYALFNLIAYGNLMAPLIRAQNLITSVAGNFTCPTSSGFYFMRIIGGSILSALFFIGIIKNPFSYLKQKEWKTTLMLLMGLVPFVYLSFFLNCKDIRYSLLFVPYAFILSGVGLYRVHKKISSKAIKVSLLIFVLLLQIIISIKIVNSEYKWLSYKDNYKDKNKEFYEFIEDKNVKGKIWASDPFASAFHDIKTDEIIYYPVLDNNKVDFLLSSINNEVEYVFINTCDIPCVSGSYCELKKKEFFNLLKSKFFVYKYEKNNDCERFAFRWKK